MLIEIHPNIQRCLLGQLTIDYKKNRIEKTEKSCKTLLVTCYLLFLHSPKVKCYFYILINDYASSHSEVF